MYKPLRVAAEALSEVSDLGQYAANYAPIQATLTGTVPVSADDTLASLGFEDGGMISFRSGAMNGPFDFTAETFQYTITSAATETVAMVIASLNALVPVDPARQVVVAIVDGFFQATTPSPYLLGFTDFPLSALVNLGIDGFPIFGKDAPGYDFTTTAEHVEATERYPDRSPGSHTSVDEQLGLIKANVDANRAILKGVRMANTFAGDGVFAMRFANVLFSSGQTYPFISCFVGATRITSIVQDGDDMVVNGVNYDPVTGNPIPANSVFGFLFIGQLFDDGGFG